MSREANEHQIPPKSLATRKRLIRIAERIFAEKGFRAMTVRDVTQAAKVNVAAINYHFGSKKDLMKAVVGERFIPVNQERMRLLTAASARCAPDPIPVLEIMDILIRPVFELAMRPGSNNRSLIQMFGRCFAEPVDFIQEMHESFFTQICNAFMHELKRSLPDQTEGEIRLGFFFAISAMIGAISDEGRMRFITERSEMTDVSLEHIVDGLVRFAAGGMIQSDPSG